VAGQSVRRESRCGGYRNYAGCIRGAQTGSGSVRRRRSVPSCRKGEPLQQGNIRQTSRDCRKPGNVRSGISLRESRICKRLRAGAHFYTGGKPRHFADAASGGGNHGIFLQKGGGAAAFGGNELGGHDRVRTGDRHDGCGCGDGSHSDQKCGGSGAFGCGRAECDCKRYKPAASAAHGTRGDAAPWRDEPADGGFGGVSAESSD